MGVAIVDPQNRAYAFLAAALAAEGLATFGTTEIGEAGASETALILAGREAGETFAFVAELRARHPATPQLVVIEQDDVELRLAAYEAGADDCLSKPFHFRELAAKLRALRRRALQGSTVQLLAGAGVEVDLIALELRVAGKTKKLTKREADLLALLARAGGGPVRREDVLRDAWDAAPGLTGNLVDVYVGYVRRKLQQLGAGVTVRSVRGEGFLLAASQPKARPSAAARASVPAA